MDPMTRTEPLIATETFRTVMNHRRQPGELEIPAQARAGFKGLETGIIRMPPGRYMATRKGVKPVRERLNWSVPRPMAENARFATPDPIFFCPSGPPVVLECKNMQETSA